MNQLLQTLSIQICSLSCSVKPSCRASSKMFLGNPSGTGGNAPWKNSRGVRKIPLDKAERMTLTVGLTPAEADSWKAAGLCSENCSKSMKMGNSSMHPTAC